MNLRPATPLEEADDYFENFWTTDKLVLDRDSYKKAQITGCKDLTAVKRIDLKVDSRKVGLGDLGKLLPNLEQLKLNNSHVPLLRCTALNILQLEILVQDIGTSYIYGWQDVMLRI